MAWPRRSSFLVAAALVIGLAGCDATSVFQDAVDAGPPRPTHLTVQDEVPGTGRGIAVDFLGAGPPETTCTSDALCPYSTATLGYFPCGTLNGEVLGDGRCHDPHDPSEVAPPIGLRAAHGGSQIRLSFNKLLAPGIETAGDGGATWTLAAGVFQLELGGVVVPALAYYDPSGSDMATDPALIDPYGPALVLEPLSPLSVATEYTLLFDGALVTDESGQPSATASLTTAFTTEGLFVMQPWNCPSGNCGANHPDVSTTSGQAIATDEYMSFLFNADVDEASGSQVTLSANGQTFPVEVFRDRGADPTRCAEAENPRRIDVVPVSAKGVRATLPPGYYTLSLRGLVDADTERTAMTPLLVTLQVQGSAQPGDLYAAEDIALPEECLASRANGGRHD